MKATILTRILIAGAIASLCACAKPDGDYSFDIGSNIDVPGYDLKQAVVLSRHNIRSPLSAPGSLLERMTPHSWHLWDVPASHLTSKGGELEAEMGSYFRQWLQEEGLFQKDYRPTQEQVRIYANAKQRTIATAESFLSGLIPNAPISVETHAEFDTMDPVFNPQLTLDAPSYQEDAKKQIASMFGEQISSLGENYSLLSDVLDFHDSKAFKDGEIGGFSVDDTELTLTLNKEPAMKGSLKNACSASDALVLQYYEETDDETAGFGRKLTFEQWKSISHIKDLYGDVLFAAPLVSVNVAHPLLMEIESELNDGDRRFCFLCGHDSNLTSVLSALDVAPYSLPGSIESKTPIGAKVVFSTYSDQSQQDYVRIDMVYQNVDCLRNKTPLDLKNHPTLVPLRFNGLQEDGNGLYKKSDFLSRIQESIAGYEKLQETYAD